MRQMKRSWWLTLVSGLCLGFAQAYAAAPSYRIQLADVTGVVLATHPELVGVSLELPGRIESHVPSPALAAGPLEHQSAAERTGSIRLHCAREGECLPFYVLVHLDGSAPATASDAVSQRAAKRNDPTTTAAGTAATVIRPNAAAAGNLSQQNPAAPVLRSGERVSMLIDSGLLHLRFPVTCLQSGAVGSTIRVTVLGRGRVLEAAVVDQATVRGSLQ